MSGIYSQSDFNSVLATLHNSWCHTCFVNIAVLVACNNLTVFAESMSPSGNLCLALVTLIKYLYCVVQQNMQYQYVHPI